MSTGTLYCTLPFGMPCGMTTPSLHPYSHCIGTYLPRFLCCTPHISSLFCNCVWPLHNFIFRSGHFPQQHHPLLVAPILWCLCQGCFFCILFNTFSWEIGPIFCSRSYFLYTFFFLSDQTFFPEVHPRTGDMSTLGPGCNATLFRIGEPLCIRVNTSSLILSFIKRHQLPGNCVGGVQFLYLSLF